MKLIRAGFKNFRLLKNLNLDFSVSNDKPLTVIRAANETGKTTIETALIWGFFGSKALPSKGKYPLYPSDSLGQCKSIEISVEIDFENEQVIPTGKGNQRIENCHYRLYRSCSEKLLNGAFIRENEQLVLLEITADGTNPVQQNRINSIIENSIPEALKDVYFTDGDSAMSFIEAAATQGVKRRRVKDAIEALLGLELLEKTKRHINQVASKFSSQIDDTDYGKELQEVNDKIDGYTEDIIEWENKQIELSDLIKLGEKESLSIKSSIEEILKLGDKSKLLEEVKKCEVNISRNTDSASRALKDVASLFRNNDLAESMIAEVARDGLKILNEMNDKKQLPKVNIPILEELLSQEICFCGEDLRNNTDIGKAHRRKILEAIENSRDSDARQEVISSLYYNVRSKYFDANNVNNWLEKYNSLSRNYFERNTDISKFEQELKEKQNEISKMKDSNLQEYKALEKENLKKLRGHESEFSILTEKIRAASERKSDLEITRGRMEKKLNKTDHSADKLKLARICQSLFDSVFDALRHDELKKVSMEMNRIFLDMIGSDPNANDLTLITKAELTSEFDIIVYGSHGHMLNPDQDLNGASRRAITLAFILALTKVSKVVAPNIIDTPLGMMSGYVKQAVLRKMLEEGSQIILFLTHDEIQGVENILDKKAGLVYTLTNPAHYPKMLANKPNVNDARVIRCECNHRQTCFICERKNIEQY
ncbi:AAA family ATPase [Thiothrix fructosivorans]|uniref:AAA family ATPase n=1 Tax=Thiothrix fructosivorans TaxID=111770 RepID=A0A8B0SKZ5_9GAMM|nr:AAA family ATPase [Thiothrix fructosivorans]MBO0612507.1 AAA family ATPase [Thiothrix fructosivorans]QTX12016.1 AAA family ATPase [Thiothrix fructosivorans]